MWVVDQNTNVDLLLNQHWVNVTVKRSDVTENRFEWQLVENEII